MLSQLLPYVNMHTKGQSGSFYNSLQNMLPFTIKLSKKQSGGALDTILTPIGIPPIIDMLKGRGLQVDRRRSRRSLPVYFTSSTSLHLYHFLQVLVVKKMVD